MSRIQLLWHKLTLDSYRENVAIARNELANAQAELDLLIYGIQHPGERIEVPIGHSARNGVLATAWRHYDRD